jgi:thiol-disulfide isomerase/thioredoxin
MFMTQTIIQRVFLSTEIFLACILVIKSFGAYSGWKVRLQSRKNRLPVTIKTGKPMLLYFWTSDCAQCKPQEQQIEQAQTVLRKTGKSLNVQKLNALDELPLAKLMNVMTVPTTVLIDSNGNVTAWNPGLTQAQKIVEQYSSLN